MYYHKTTLPHSKLEVKFRPWTIADELEYSDNENQLDFIKKVVENSDFLNNVSNAEIYWLLKEIRTVSKMSNIDFNWVCLNDKCSTSGQHQPNKFDIDTDISFEVAKIDNIVIDDNLTYYFKNLTFAESIEFNTLILDTQKDNKRLDFKKSIVMKICFCVTTIVDDDNILENLSYAEKYKFITSRPKGELESLVDMFSKTQNIITMKKNCKCPICGTEREVMVGVDFLHL